LLRFRRSRDLADSFTVTLTRAGYRIVRLQAELVMRDLPAAVRAVQRALDER